MIVSLVTVRSKSLPSDEPSLADSYEAAASMVGPCHIKGPYRNLRNVGAKCWLPSVRKYLVSSQTDPCMALHRTMASGSHNSRINLPADASQEHRRFLLLAVDDTQEHHRSLANLAYNLMDPSVDTQPG